ncbi:MAG: adenylyl-sulfate kinase [Saprospiraceae bacterium]
MMFIQLTGLSGSGKSTLAGQVQQQLQGLDYHVEIIDGDVYRQHLCSDLDFSRAGRLENIRRLGCMGITLARNGVIAIMAAINPYAEMRQWLEEQSDLTRTVWIDCDLETLQQRDTKGLYRRAMLPEGHPDKINNLTGLNDPFEKPEYPHLLIHTNTETEAGSTRKLFDFILREIAARKKLQ